MRLKHSDSGENNTIQVTFIADKVSSRIPFLSNEGQKVSFYQIFSFLLDAFFFAILARSHLERDYPPLFSSVLACEIPREPLGLSILSTKSCSAFISGNLLSNFGAHCGILEPQAIATVSFDQRFQSANKKITI